MFLLVKIGCHGGLTEFSNQPKCPCLSMADVCCVLIISSPCVWSLLRLGVVCGVWPSRKAEEEHTLNCLCCLHPHCAVQEHNPSTYSWPVSIATPTSREKWRWSRCHCKGDLDSGEKDDSSPQPRATMGHLSQLVSLHTCLDPQGRWMDDVCRKIRQL